MKKAFLFVTLALLLTSCNLVQSAAADQPAIPASETPASQPTRVTEMLLSERTDNQGKVTVVVKPELWISGSDFLIFEISLDTHSIDLNFDLATISMLTTDNGLIIQAYHWDAPPGGHHVNGKLSFPAQVDGKYYLEEVNKLVLTIKDLDAAERVFTWELFR